MASTTTAATSFDVLIFGAGPAGSAAAIGLVRSGLSVCMVDRVGDGPTNHAGEIASPEIAPALARLGVWQDFLEHPHMPCHGLRIAWGSSQIEQSSYMLSPYGQGWHIDRRRFDQLLVARARNLGVTVISKARPSAFARDSGERWRVIVSNGTRERVLTARFVVDATGRGSALRRRLGAQDHVHDRLIGVAAWFDGEEQEACQEGGGALVEAAERGWWYSAPASDGRRVVVLMTDPDLYRDDRRCSPNHWRDQLAETRHVCGLVQQVSPNSSPRVHLAQSHQVVRLGRPGFLPVGDALQSRDPLCGRGLLDALESGERAVPVIQACLDGDVAAVDIYLREAQTAFTTYLLERVQYYGLERRWQNSPFWRRRLRSG